MRTLVDYRPALSARTGVGEYVHELSRALVRAGRDDVTLFSSSRRQRLAADAVPGAHVIDRHWPVRVLNYTWHRWQWPPVERLAGRTFDVVQSMHPLVVPSRHAAQVVTIHDLDFLDHPERTSAEIRRDYAALAPRHARQAHHIVTVSHFTASRIVDLLEVPMSKISVCPGGAPDWAPRDREPDDAYLLFLGTLEPRKNVGLLLDAYERLLATGTPMPRLVLAGRAAPGSEDWLRRAAAAPLAPHVDVRGYVNPADRRALVAGAMALILPSLMEGFGLPLVEAMTVGVPAIASNRGSLPEVLGGAGVVFDPDHVDELVTSIEQVVASPGLRRTLAERGHARARFYNWDETARRTREAWMLAFEARRRRAA